MSHAAIAAPASPKRSLAKTAMAEAILNDAFGEEVSCPVCKADRFLNPSLKLLVSPCFHRMCEACINRIYTQGPAPCPTCQSDEGKTNILRKSNFVLQTFDNLDVEKEVGLRRHLSAVFNKRLEDFDGDLRAYNDYLEHVEGLLFNLVHGIDVAQTAAAIEAYRAANREQIAAGAQRALKEERAFARAREREARAREQRSQAYAEAEQQVQRAKREERASIIELLTNTTRPAAEIIRDQQQARRAMQGEARNATRGLRILADSDEDDDDEGGRDGRDGKDGGDAPFVPIDPIDGLFDDPLAMPAEQRQYPSTHPLMVDPKAMAGGYLPQFTWQRAIFSAYLGLLDV